jgi:hypothetical protein
MEAAFRLTQALFYRFLLQYFGFITRHGNIEGSLYINPLKGEFLLRVNSIQIQFVPHKKHLILFYGQLVNAV